MKIVDNGVLESSFMDFSIPSDFAKSALYYSPQFGHFYCNGEYSISRDSLPLFLMIYVCSGSLFIDTRERSFVAADNQIALIDCRYPHRYYCSDAVEFLWFHFSGNSSEPYARHLFEQFGVVFSGQHIPDLRKNFEAVFSSTQSVLLNEHQISLNIHQILSLLAVPERRTVFINQLLSPAVVYISENFDKDIDLGQLAGLCNISTSHFIRSFKRYMSCTPHEYLLSYRLRQSKYLLLSSQMLSIEQIAEKCGFNSASHYARAFRKSCGITPTEFRNIPF